MNDVDASVLATMIDAEARLRLGDVAGVEELLDHVSQRATDRHGQRLRARVATARSRLATLHSRSDRALEAAQDAIEAWSALGEFGEAASARALVARILVSVGSTEEALAEANTACEEANRDGDARSVMDATIALGHVYYGMQRFDQALVPFERALQTARALGDRIAEGSLLDTIACVYGNQASALAAQEDKTAMRSLLAKALDLWEQASPIAHETGHRRNQVAVLANEAEALVALDRPEDALALLQRWKLDPKVDLARSIWHIRDTEGVACLRLGRHAEAIDKFTEALPYADSGAMKMVAHEHLAEAFEQAGDTASALMHHKRFHACYKQLASEAAQRSASVAAVRLATDEANAMAIAERGRAEELAVSNDRLSRRADDLMQLSLEDPLTGLANRRMMDKLLEADARGFAVAMLDVDHFKRVNDGWSHATGDEVLKQLAVLMRGCCRASDTPIRCGGEEFAILSRYLNEEGTELMAERIRHTIETFDWTSVAPGLAVTVSIGIALASEADTTGEALALADRRLYAAKRAGRNRVVGRAFESVQEIPDSSQ